MSVLFESVELSAVQIEQLEKPLILPPTIQDIYNRVANNSQVHAYNTYDEFYSDLKVTLNFYFEGLDNKQIIHH